jgi:hypothetical protein
MRPHRLEARVDAPIHEAEPSSVAHRSLGADLENLALRLLHYPTHAELERATLV